MLKQKALPGGVRRNHSQLRHHQTQKVLVDIQSGSGANSYEELGYADHPSESQHSTLPASKTAVRERASQQPSDNVVAFKGVPKVQVQDKGKFWELDRSSTEGGSSFRAAPEARSFETLPTLARPRQLVQL